MKKMYVLVRKDMPKSYQAVQAGHALAEYLMHVQHAWTNGTLVYLNVRNEKELYNWIKVLNIKGIDWKGFWEPDVGDELTAICTNGVDERLFEGLELM